MAAATVTQISAKADSSIRPKACCLALRSALIKGAHYPMDEETVAFVGILLAGAAACVVGVFMWQGAWAALAALGLLVALFAMSREG